eukprot:m.370098 g.370098  ORF g.370098 m.370098 type:complete len:65 (+) comp16680_c1_seq39:1350-1544(+)
MRRRAHPALPSGACLVWSGCVRQIWAVDTREKVAEFFALIQSLVFNPLMLYPQITPKMNSWSVQ